MKQMDRKSIFDFSRRVTPSLYLVSLNILVPCGSTLAVNESVAEGRSLCAQRSLTATLTDPGRPMSEKEAVTLCE